MALPDNERGDKGAHLFADAARCPDAKEGGVVSKSDSRLFANSRMDEWHEDKVG